MAAVMEVRAWSGDWSLPSIDTRCLEVLAYAKFAGCPLKVDRCNNPWKSPLGEGSLLCLNPSYYSAKGKHFIGQSLEEVQVPLTERVQRPYWEFPVLRSGGDVVTTTSKIMDYFRRKNFNADYHLNAKQGADTLAFVSMVHSKLYPAISYTFWMDESNYTKLTRPWYAKRLPFPLNYFVPGKMSRQKRSQICEGAYSQETDNLQLENKLFKDALECFKFLSTILGDKEFFFGDRPTYLDAVVFANLAVICKAPLPNNKLHNYLQGYENLSMFFGRVLQRYFPPETEEQQQQGQPSARRSPTQEDASADSAERRNTLLAVVFATVAMTAYAFLSGLFQIEITRTSESGKSEVD
ncbi:metaxin-1-like isoform X1 [Montipora capricornis]|uniref:metaxin-1-like isoform X1 n=1 Tax=Montipora capricornis TaxID=246305 RepID=UPI0035F117B4